MNSKFQFLKNNKISNPIKKDKKFNSINRKNLNVNKLYIKRQKEKKINKFIKSFKNLKEKELYKLYKKIFTKTDNELNDLPYKDALKYDHRKYFAFYFSLVKNNHLIFFSFLSKFDFNSRIIKMYLFFFNFATFFFVNALFFTDETMGKINTDGGYFNIIYNLPQIIYSSIISSIINEIIKIFSLTESSFIIFRNQLEKGNILKTSTRLKRYLKIKFVIFFILDFILLGCFWIYLSCFSAVYNNTQIHLIKDTLISFAISLITPFVLYLLPGIFRIPSLKNGNRRILYVINNILQFIL